MSWGSGALAGGGHQVAIAVTFEIAGARGELPAADRVIDDKKTVARNSQIGGHTGGGNGALNELVGDGIGGDTSADLH